jgi:hypothetical protein
MRMPARINVPSRMDSKKAKESPMGIFSFFTQRRRLRMVAQMAEGIAGRSQAAVLDRVRRRATTMRVSEARGYVRSRALDLVHRELSALHGGRITLDPATQTEVISQATELVVTKVMAEMRNVPAARPRKSKAA